MEVNHWGIKRKILRKTRPNGRHYPGKYSNFVIITPFSYHGSDNSKFVHVENKINGH